MYFLSLVEKGGFYLILEMLRAGIPTPSKTTITQPLTQYQEHYDKLRLSL